MNRKTEKQIKDFFEFGRMLMSKPGMLESLPSEIYIPAGVNLAGILSGKRLELLACIAKHPDKTVTELSNELKRKKEAISRDLRVLKKHNLVTLKKKGREKEVETAVKYVLIPIPG